MRPVELRLKPATPLSGHSFFLLRSIVAISAAFLCLLVAPPQLVAGHDREEPSAGYVKEFSASLDDAMQALQELVQDQTIHGTYVFDREKTLTGARMAESTPLFTPWNSSGGKVFYKLRPGAIAPRHFRDSADQGTIAVRFVVTTVSPERTRLRIDAIFVEEAHRTVHASDGTVETSEYKVFQEHLQAIQFAKQEAIDARRRRDSIALARQTVVQEREDENTRWLAAHSSVQDLEQQVNTVRHRVEKRIKAPGATLKAAPFRSAANVANLGAYTEVVIVIVTPHWYGVETPVGQRGWLPLDELESLP
jgi:hypothetical protein